jgi:glycosyltransferase involved in cell wall biosynthesis
MKLALVHDWLTGMRGGEKCLEPLCRRYPDARLFTLLHAPGTTAPAIERMRITTSFLQRVPGVARHYRYLLPLMPRAVEGLAIPPDTDLVVSFSHAVAKGVRPPSGVPHVCYCFTPMRYAWHLREEYFPSPGGGAQIVSGKIARAPLAAVRSALLDRIRDWDRAASDRVTHYVAISRTVADRIRQSYGRTSRIIYPPVDTEFYTPADVPREDYYLVVSALVPYKRIDQAIEAANRLGRRLVVVGSGPDCKRLAGLAGPTVAFVGWRSNEEIRDHFRRCRALVFPGHEDFGIVPLEAQACGAPVIALARGGATETVIPAAADRPGTGWLYDEPKAEGLIAAIERFEAQPDRCSPTAARAQAERFNARRYERELIDYLAEVVPAAAPA